MVSYKFLRILGGREMSQTFHALEIRAGDLLRGRLAHFGRRAPVIFAGEEVDGALFHVDAGHAVSGVEAAEIEIQIAVEDAVGLARVHVLAISSQSLSCLPPDAIMAECGVGSSGVLGQGSKRGKSQEARCTSEGQCRRTQISCLFTFGLFGAIMP